MKTILPVYDCVVYKHPEKKQERVIYVPVPTEDVFTCSEVEEIDATGQV